MGSFIELQNINLTYNKGKDNAYQALFNVNLKINKGEFVVIFGPSGCGKSSLLNVLAGLEDPDEGSAFIDDKNLLIMKEVEKVEFHCTKMGMIFQSYNLIPTLNVLNNVALPQMFNDKGKKEREVRAMEVLERFGISQQWKRIPTELSGGQQQRIGIARAIVNDPEIILADEPIGNLDTKSANNVMEILGNLNRKEGKTVIMVSHNPENIIWGSHIVYMKDGMIIREEFKEADQVKQIENEEGNNKSEFDKMIERFNGLSEEQIALMINPMKAKIITDSLLVSYERSQTAVMEKNIELYLMKKIKDDQLLGNLDRDFDKGGAGMDYRVAKKFFKEVDDITKSAELFVRENDIDKKVLMIMDYLGSKLNLNFENEDGISKLGSILKAKLSGKIDHGQFKRFLDSSAGSEGVGLDKRIAKKVAKEVSLFLIVSYGIRVDDVKKNEAESLNNKN